MLAALKSQSELADDLRRTATTLAPFAEAERVVRSLKSEIGLKPKIIEQLSQSPSLSSEARPLALRMAEEIEEEPVNSTA